MVCRQRVLMKLTEQQCSSVLKHPGLMRMPYQEGSWMTGESPGSLGSCGTQAAVHRLIVIQPGVAKWSSPHTLVFSAEKTLESLRE